MEGKFKSLSLKDFQMRFPDEESCKKYLAEKKWGNGFKCRRCNHHHYCSGGKPFMRQCTSCRYKESVTANTLFHKVKFRLVHAFFIVYLVATNKKGISSTELSRKLQIQQKTCWLFRLKVLQAMESKLTMGLEGNLEIIDFTLGKNKIKKNGQVKFVKKRVFMAIEKKGKGVSHMYAYYSKNKSSRELKKFVKKYIKEKSSIICPNWSSYKPLQLDFDVTFAQRKGKKNRMGLSKRIASSLKAWLRGMHGHAELLQYYLNEYSYRFNRNQMKEGIFDHLLERMVEHKPRTYLDIITYHPNQWVIPPHSTQISPFPQIN